MESHSPPESSRLAQPRLTSSTPSSRSSAPPHRPTSLPPPDPFPRPKFRSSAPYPSAPPLLRPPYLTALTSPAHFPVGCFFSAMRDICLHPERNSALILRADPLPPPSAEDLGSIDAALEAALGARRTERLERVEGWRRRLMPKQVKRDGKLDQKCLFYRSSRASPDDTEPDGTEDVEGARSDIAVVLLVPEVKHCADVPFYHPPVQRLAFIYESAESSVDSLTLEAEGEGPPVLGRISIAYVPFPDSDLLNTPSGSTPRPASLPRLANGGPIPNLTRKAPRKRSSLSGPSIGPDGGLSSGTSLSASANTLLAAVDAPLEASENALSRHDRLERTCRALLEQVYKHGYGDMLGYQKRVHHDVVVPREPFQDLYLTLKDRHRHLESRKPRSGYTLADDVKRHVFKHESLPTDPLLPSFIGDWGSQDIAIAAFLMLLWKDMYPAVSPLPADSADGRLEDFPTSALEERREWDIWGRPPGGFLDLGCGNGLLVHILVSEGYAGTGVELRARRTWPLYPPATRAALHEIPIDLPSWFPATMDEWAADEWAGREACRVVEGCFIIGNHADEITPWIPLLSLLPRTPSPFLSLPCCLHTLDSAFTASSFSPPAHPHAPPAGFGAGLEGGESRYKAYLMWLGWLGLQAGWTWEKESLRVPSTKGWGIVGRHRWTEAPGAREDEAELRKCREWALEQVRAVRAKGAFKVREMEGKDH